MDLVEKVIPEIEDDLAIQIFQGVAKRILCWFDFLHDCGISEHTLSLLEKSQMQKFENECFAFWRTILIITKMD